MVSSNANRANKIWEERQPRASLRGKHIYNDKGGTQTSMVVRRENIVLALVG